MKIILDTHSSNPDFSGDCDYAVVDLTPALVEQIRRRVELAQQVQQQDGDLWELYFWGGTAEFWGSDLLDACADAVAAAKGMGGDQAACDWREDLDSNGYALLPPGVGVEAFESQCTECCQMILRCSPSPQSTELEIAWTASPKHTDIYVTTRDLPLAVVEGFVSQQQESVSK
jgi:hypothetical protein